MTAADVRSLTFRDSAMDWLCKIDAELNQQPGLYQLIDPRKVHEFTRFWREWPCVAAAIGLEEPSPLATRFEVGEVLRPTLRLFPRGHGAWLDPRNAIADHIDWREILDEHATGSFGLYDKCEPILVENKAAITTRSGVIRSRFVLSDSLQTAARKKEKQAVADVVTIFSQRGPRTLMTIEFIELATGG